MKKSERERMKVRCSVCGKTFTANMTGRPPKKCDKCKGLWKKKSKPKSKPKTKQTKEQKEESYFKRLGCTKEFYMINRRLLNDVGMANRQGITYGQYMAQKRRR